MKSKAADPAHPSLTYSHAIARIEYEYDANGARTAARTYSQANTLLYSEATPRDERGRADYKDAPLGRLDYDYHANGLLKDIVSSNAGGLNVGYRYDDANRLAYVDDVTTGQIATTSYAYNPNGSLEKVTAPNDVAHTYSYDSPNRLRTLSIARIADPANPLHTYDYKLRVSGHRRQVVEHNGRTTSYSYDELYRLTGESVTAGTGDPVPSGSITYDLDKVGNRLNRVSTMAAIVSQLPERGTARARESSRIAWDDHRVQGRRDLELAGGGGGRREGNRRTRRNYA